MATPIHVPEEAATTPEPVLLCSHPVGGKMVVRAFLSAKDRVEYFVGPMMEQTGVRTVRITASEALALVQVARLH